MLYSYVFVRVGELRVALSRERELRGQLENELASEKRANAELRKKLNKEKDLRKQFEEQANAVNVDKTADERCESTGMYIAYSSLAFSFCPSNAVFFITLTHAIMLQRFNGIRYE